MSEEKRLMIENDLCMNKSKAQVIKLYLDLMEQYNKEIDKLTAESTEWEERTYCWQDRAENLQIVLDKIKEYIKELKNFKIKYVMLEEKELFASEKDFVKDILELLEEIK